MLKPYQSLIISLFILFLSAPAQSLDVYVDSSTTSSGSGSSTDPFKTLDQAFQKILASSQQDKSVTIFLKGNEDQSPYQSQDLISLNNEINPIQSFIISVWESSVESLKSQEACAKLPRIDGSVLRWKFGNMASVKFSGLYIVDFKGQILIENAKEVVISGSCMKNSKSGTQDDLAMEIWNSNRLIIEDTIFVIDQETTKFIGVTNSNAASRNSEVLLQNISVVVHGVNTSNEAIISCFDFVTTDQKESSYLNPPRFLNWKTTQDVMIKNFKVKFAENDGTSKQILPFIGSFSGWNNVTIEEFSIENEEFYMAESTIFQFLDVLNVKVSSGNFTNNTILTSDGNESTRRLSLFLAVNVYSVNLNNFDVSKNNFLVGENLKSLFQLINMQQVMYFNMENLLISFNKFENEANIINFLPQSSSQVEAIILKNITINNNTNPKDPLFSFLTAEGIFLINLYTTDFFFTNNSLTGKVFFFEKMTDNDKTNKRMNFANVLIENCTSPGLAFFYLYAFPQTADPVPALQWTTATFTNLMILNSNFTGRHALDWQDQDSLLEVLNAKLYVEKSEIRRNHFDSFDFIVMRSQVSSAFIVNTTFDNNTMTRSTIMITKFDRIYPLQSSFCSTYYKEIYLQYRFAYVLWSNFTNLVVNKVPLFVLNTPYIIFANNTFDVAQVSGTELMILGDFYPQTCGIKELVFKRDQENEAKAFEDLNPELFKIFQYNIGNQKALPSKYFYLVSSNRFNDLVLWNKGMILLKEYNFNEGAVIIQGNNISKIRNWNFSSHLIQTNGPILNFNFAGNKIDTIKPFRSIVRFSEFLINKNLFITSNTITNYQGYSAFMVSGVNITTTKIIQNNVTRSQFINSIFSLEVTESQGAQTWLKNYFAENYLNAVDTSLSDLPPSVFDLDEIIKPMNPLKIIHSTNSFIILNLERNEGPLSFVSNVMKNSTVQTIDGSLYTKISFVLISIQGTRSQSPFLMSDFQFTDNIYKNVPDFSFYKELNALISVLVGNSRCMISKSTFEDVEIHSRGNSLFYVAASNSTIIDNTIQRLTADNENFIFDLMVMNSLIKGNTFSDIEIHKGGALKFNPTSPREGLDYAVKVLFIENYFDNLLVPEVSQNSILGNILTFKNNTIVFYAESNTIVDSFNMRPAFNFEDTTCSFCVFKNTNFITKRESPSVSEFFWISGCNGDFMLDDTQIYHQEAQPTTRNDRLLSIQKSPLIKATINGLNFVQEYSKVSLRLASLDSGSLTVKNLEIKDATYLQNQAVIQVLGDSTNTMPVHLSMSDVVFRKLVYIPEARTVKIDENGLIDFKVRGERPLERYPLNFKLENSTFLDIKNISVVAFRVPEMNSSLIKNATFQNIENIKGPAVNSLARNPQDAPLEISLCNFSGNHAYRVGGAISINPTNYSISENNFFNNHADSLGSAVYLGAQEVNQTLVKDNKYENNTAPYGQEIVSSVAGLKLEFYIQKEMGLYIETTAEDQRMIIRNASSRGVSSTALNITFYDFNGFRTLDLNSNNPYLALHFGGKTNHQKIVPTNCSEAGCFIPNINVILSGEPDEIINVRVEYISAVQATVKSQWETTFDIELRGCVSGEHANQNSLTCDYCSKGTFSLNTGFPCQDCPINAICRGGNSIEAKEGFWRSDLGPASTSLVECKKDGIVRCQGGALNNGCSSGFAGPKCEACDFQNGYVESGLLNCKKCKNNWESLLLSLGGMLVYIVYKAVCIAKMYSTNEIFSNNQANNAVKFTEAAEKGYYVKLLLVYSQILSLIFLFNVEVKGALSSLLQIGNPSEFILVNLQCSMLALKIAPQDFLYVSTSILLLSPIVQTLVIIIMAKVFVQRFFPALKMSRFIRLTVVYLILLEQPGIVGNLTSFLSCSSDNVHGSFITLHPNWSCTDSRYIFFKKFLATPFLAFWALILPAFMFLSLYFRRRKLEELEVRGIWGVLYNLFKPSHYYWGTVVTILSLSISYISYTYQEDPKTSAFTIFLLLCTYQLSVRLMKPYKFAKFNFAEGLTFNLLMLSVVLGYFGNDIQDRTLKYIAYGILGVLNGGMFLFLGLKVFDVVAMRYVQETTKRLKNWFGYKEFEQEDVKYFELTDRRFTE